MLGRLPLLGLPELEGLLFVCFEPGDRVGAKEARLSVGRSVWAGLPVHVVWEDCRRVTGARLRLLLAFDADGLFAREARVGTRCAEVFLLGLLSSKSGVPTITQLSLSV